MGQLTLMSQINDFTLGISRNVKVKEDFIPEPTNNQRYVWDNQFSLYYSVASNRPTGKLYMMYKYDPGGNVYTKETPIMEMSYGTHTGKLVQYSFRLPTDLRFSWQTMETLALILSNIVISLALIHEEIMLAKFTYDVQDGLYWEVDHRPAVLTTMGEVYVYKAKIDYTKV